jgi:hypothetical protein
VSSGSSNNMGCKSAGCGYLASQHCIQYATVNFRTVAAVTRNRPYQEAVQGGQHLMDTQQCQNHGPVRLLVPLLEFNRDRCGLSEVATCPPNERCNWLLKPDCIFAQSQPKFTLRASLRQSLINPSTAVAFVRGNRWHES